MSSSYERHVRDCAWIGISPHPPPYPPKRWDRLISEPHRIPQLRKERELWWSGKERFLITATERLNMFLWFGVVILALGLPIRHLVLVRVTSLAAAALFVVCWFAFGALLRRRLRSVTKDKESELSLLDSLIEHPEQHPEFMERIAKLTRDD